MDPQTFDIDAAQAGERLDVVVAGHLGLSRGYVRRLLGLDRVRVNQRTAVKGIQLRTGDRIDIDAFRHPDEGPIAAEGFELVVLREAHDLIAIDKPAGFATHPLDYEETGTVLNTMLARFPELAGVGDGGLESGVVHRLDTLTSGVLLFARTDPAWQRARAAFAARRVRKRYLALVHGALGGEHDLSLRLDHRGAHMRVVESGGRESLTRIRALETRDGQTLVEARPVTGLMHQIRVALAHLGHPVVGDRTYGSSDESDRHWLHAADIALDDFEASAPPPERLLVRA